jgi:pimeloyl-ACP methyl ester carboxylesterase
MQVIRRSGTFPHELAFDCVGAPDGIPVFLLHGTPGSRRGPRPRTSVLYRLGIKLICYDRPGYGGSTRHPGRTVADAADDVRAIAEHLDLEPFSVVGRSGGAPHALACAALLGGWVNCVAALVGLAPPDAPGLDWYDGMGQSNTSEYRRIAEEPGTVAATVNERATLIQQDPTILLDQLRPDLTRQDRRIVDDVAIQWLLTDACTEGLRQGAGGWIDDALALRKSWDFDLTAIKVPVLIWHGLDDVFSPVSHSRWLADHIRGARDDAQVKMVIKPDAAHFDAVEILPDALSWVKRTVGSERLGIERPHQPAPGAKRQNIRMLFA